MIVLAGAALGALFFVWLAGIRMITPTEIAWTMQLDWHWHFLGWHFFRHEPWHFPPGRIDGYFQPMGTAIGFTDSIPLAAFVLKPFSRLLPDAFQYLGPWMLICFALQGAFGVLLMRLWTSNVAHQLLGAACFVLVPTLLSRAGHPALCSHWLLLWALWLYLRAAQTPRAPIAQSAVLGLIAGVVHPYLSVMMLGLLSALSVRLLVARRLSGVAVIVLAVCGVLAGWWLSGFFTLSGTENLAAVGLSDFSMNMLGPITPSGWSSILPAVPVAIEGQVWEGFQYLGLGLLVLMSIAIGVSAMTQSLRTPRVIWPLVIVAVLFAVYAFSPRVTFGTAVVAQVEHPLLERFAIFRATGRFFWPTAYVMLALALMTTATRLRPTMVTAILCAVVALQLVDLREAHAFRRRVSRDPGFHAWRPSLASPAWQRLLPEYDHLVLYPPSYCGAAPVVDLASVAYLAGLHGMTLNSGLVARFDERRRLDACREVADMLTRGDVDDSYLYMGRPGEIDVVKQHAKQPVVCGVIDAVGICTTARSYERWREVAHLE